jgi:hypothetical protein
LSESVPYNIKGLENADEAMWEAALRTYLAQELKDLSHAA